MLQLIPMFVGLPLIGFWVWMFVDMTNNDYISGSSKNNWMLASVAANTFTALYYYLVEYRPRHL